MAFLLFLSFRMNQRQESNFQKIGGLITKNIFALCFQLVALYFKGMPNSIDIYKEIFLHAFSVSLQFHDLIICGLQKVCVAAYFFIYFPKSFFQHFENWKIRSRVKFYAHVFLTKNIKGWSSDKKLEFISKTFYIKRSPAFFIFHYFFSKLLQLILS